MEKNHWYTKDVESVIGELDTSHEGLTSEEAEKRVQKYGYNELVETEKISPLKMFLGQFADPMVIILLIAIAISLVVALAPGSHEEGGLVDAIMISIIVIFNSIFGFAQEYRSEKALEALKDMAAPNAMVLREGLWKEIDSREVVPGDIISLDPGDIVPADARVSNAVGLSVDEAVLTGESVPVRKVSEPLDLENPAVGDISNSVFQGTTIAGGKGRAIVTETGMDTRFGEIAELVQESDKEMTPLQHDLDDLGKKLGAIITLLCVIIFVAEIFQGMENIMEALFAAIALAVSAIPEGLPAVVTITLAIGVQRMVDKNAIVRRLPSVETLGSTTVICSDKTGTITKNEMTVQHLYTNGSRIRVTGVGYDDEGDFYRDDKKIDPRNDPHLRKLLLIGQLCSNAVLQPDPSVAAKWSIVGDPTEGALLVAAEKAGLKYDETWEKYDEITEISFNSARKRMTAVFRDENGDVTAYTKGAAEIVLSFCTHILEDGEVKPLSDAKRDELLAVNADLASKALRVLGMAYRPIEEEIPDWEPENVERNAIFVGLSAMIDPPRDEVTDAINVCKSAGIRPIMITGDHELTARAIAMDVGLISGEANVVTGSDIEKMTEKEFSECVRNTNVFARVSPGHKLSIVKALKNQDQVVAMTGDGVNDAPAVKASDVGVSMGIRGADVTRESSDVILTDDNFATIVTAVEKGREIYANIRKFVRFLLVANFSEIYLVFTMIMIGLPLPITAIQILWINLATDGFPALALGVDPPEGDLMERKPRKPGSKMMNKGLAVFVLIGGFIQFLASSMVFLWLLTIYGGWIPGITGPLVNWSAAPWDYALSHARTAVFAGIVTYELLLVWNCRTEHHPVWETDITNSNALIIAVLVSVVLTLVVLYVPFMWSLFETVPLTPFEWLVILLSCLPALLLPPHKIFGYFRD
ncbi:MAG: cation-translocating P-type ATPase [Promethearchaeia archaeon]